MIFEGSRYEHSDVQRIIAPDGTARQTVLPTDPSEQTFTYTYYTVRAGDRIDILADRFLGDAEAWWVIADANPQRLFWDYLPDGVVLRIPRGLGTG